MSESSEHVENSNKQQMIWNVRLGIQEIGKLSLGNARLILLASIIVFSSVVGLDIFEGSFDREIKTFLVLNLPLVATALVFFFQLSSPSEKSD